MSACSSRRYSFLVASPNFRAQDALLLADLARRGGADEARGREFSDQGVVIFPSHFFIGLVLGLLRRWTGSLYPGIAVHAAWNARVIWLELASG
jgi:membrane protease YdiL (CAAX protease family)